MKKVKLWPAPQVELGVSVTDQMMEDYKECARLARKTDFDGKDCDTCSWGKTEIGNTTMCQFKEMEHLLREGDNE